MASLSAQQQHELALSAAYEDDTPTPLGWRRKLIPHIGKGLVPARTDVVFIAPNGEEFKSKVQLQRYLKSKKGSPSLSEFIWITDETPRRSSRSASKRYSKSPPKSASKKKPAARAPLQELKATKRRRHTSNEDVEGSEGDEKKRPKKETSVESTGDMEASPTWSSGSDSKTKKPLKATKEEKNMRGEAQSSEVSSEAYTSENSSELLRESEKLEEEAKGGELIEENDKDVETTVNGEEEAIEEPIFQEIRKEEGRKLKSGAVEERSEAMESSFSEDHSKTANFQGDSKDSDDDDKDAHIRDDEDGSKEDGTTLSLLGSDFSTDGMEAESDIFESVKTESPKAEKDRCENIPDGSEKDMMIMSPKNHLIDEAAK